MAELKAACKEWGLTTTGRKAELLQRLRDQVEDSATGAGGRAPRHCHVCAATRRELTHYSRRRISQAKIKVCGGAGVLWRVVGARAGAECEK